MIFRELTEQLLDAARQFPVIGVLGPRQSGKTTLVQKLFDKHSYISLEDYDYRAIANSDPRRFLKDFPNKHGIILDEIQHAPQLLSYIQTIVDREKKKGFFVITGSQNLLVNEKVTQSLAGRIALLNLYPLSISELNSSSLLPKTMEDTIFNGSYPVVYSEDVSPSKIYPRYLRSYIERDVRELKNIGDLNIFNRFLQLCAGRTGQILNLSTLGDDLGIDHKTVRSWISVLEATYVIFLLYPYYRNFGRRLIRSPKLYFVDTGIACSLLNIKSAKELISHHMRGHLFETYIVSDLFKQYYNLDQKPSLYFWRDGSEREIDCIIEESEYTIPLEIKAGTTIASDFFKQFGYWQSIAPKTSERGLVIYGGSETLTLPEARAVGWQSIGHLIKNLQIMLHERL